MCIHAAIISFLFFMQYDDPFPEKNEITQVLPNGKSCKTNIDSLTNKLIYTTADVLPVNEGGTALLMRALVRDINPNLDGVLVPEEYDPNIVVAFIVDSDGSIKGERIINDKTNVAGQQMLDIVKTFKWIPAICKGKKVAMLYTLPVIIDIAEN